MNKMRQKTPVILILALAAVLFFCTGSMASHHHKPITQKLIHLIEKDPRVGELLTKSIKSAACVNTSLVTNPVQSLEAYYDYIDKAVELIPQDQLENHKPEDLIRVHILQSISYFYFLIDQPLPELERLVEEGKLYKNAIQYWEPFATWTREFANEWGKFLDTKKSWNTKTLKQFWDDPKFGLQQGWYQSSLNWRTFNQFFARFLRTPGERPIACPNERSVVVSPADSVPQGVWKIDKDSNIVEPAPKEESCGVKAKFMTIFNVKDLLAESAFKDDFAGGVLTHTFLNVFDYHRYHFAVGGTVLEKRVVQRNVALEVSWNAKDGEYVPIDSTGWQFTQTLGYVIVDTGKYGLVALIPMGMAQVSSVNFEDNVFIGSKHKKGDMLGNFLFGGSDFIMLFQDTAGFKLMTQLKVTKPGEPKEYQHIFMGSKYGVMQGKY